MKSLLRRVKNKLFKPGVQPLAIRSGPFAGVIMNLDLGSQTQKYMGWYEHELHRWVRRYQSDIKTLIDVGSEAGVYTMFALLRTGADKVLAFEPNPVVRDSMRQNFALNNLKIADPRLVWSESFVGNENASPIVSLNQVAGAAAGPILVKLDIEGGEIDALHGAGALLARKDVRWLIETHSVECENGCLELLKAAGLTVKIVKNAWWRLFIPEHRAIPLNRWVVAHHPSDAI